MRKICMAALLALMLLTLAGCGEAQGQGEEHEPELHFVHIPLPDGTLQPMPVFY